MAIRLVTDSTADLPSELAQRWGITVVPLRLHFSQEEGASSSSSNPSAKSIETLRDGVDIGPDEFYRRLTQSPTLPTTSQPSIQDFVDVYQRLSQTGNQVISVHVSSRLSGTVNSAVQAQRSLEAATQVEVVDSMQVSMGLGMVVLAGARAAEEGASFDEVLRVIKNTARQVRLFFMVDTLEYLQKGGRIGKAQAFLGSLLGIKPILTCQEGEVYPMERVRTRSRALERLAQIAEGLAPVAELYVVYSTTPEDAEVLRDRLRSLQPPDNILVSKLSPVIGTHVGPGTVGIAVRPES